MANVLILGNDTRAFLCCIRSLGRYGLNVYAGECTREDVNKSIFIKQQVNFGDFNNSPHQWCLELKKLMEEIDFVYILPVDDPSILKIKYYEKYYGELPGLYVQNEYIKHIVDNKKQSTQLACQLNVPVAKTKIALSIDDLCSAIEELGYPIVVKPHESFSREDQKTKDKVLILESEKEYNDSKRIIEYYLKKYNSIIVQKFFRGVGTGVEILAYNGEILTAFQHMRVHEPQKGGGSSLRKSVLLDQRMLNDTKKIVRELSYTGVMMVEFKINVYSKEYVFIEINGRMWGSLPLAVSAGIDFPVYLYEMYVEGKRKFNTNYKVGLYQQNFETDFWWKVNTLKNGKIVFLIREIWCQLIRVVTQKEKIDEFALDDKLVLKHTCVELVHKIKQSRMQKRLRISLEKKTNIPIKKITKKDRILFVCYGNICRSAFANLYRNELCGSSISTYSAGYFRKGNREIDSDISKIADDFGIKTDIFRSNIITSDLMEWADYIFVFDEKNYLYILQNYKSFEKKVYLLGAYDRDRFSSPFICDPYGLEHYDKVVIINRIADIIEKYLVN